MPPASAGCSKGGEHEWTYDGATAGWKDAEGNPYTWISYTCRRCKTSHGERVYKTPRSKEPRPEPPRGDETAATDKRPKGRNVEKK